MTAVAYSTSRWDGALYSDTTRVLLYDVRDEPFSSFALARCSGRRAPGAAYRIEPTQERYRGVEWPERNGDLLLLDIGPFRTATNPQHHMQAKCSCGAVIYISRSEWLNRAKKCRQRCYECSFKTQRGKRR